MGHITQNWWVCGQSHRGLPEISKLAQHVYEKGHWLSWDEARILEIESNRRYRKYEKLAHIDA
jgi:hypothetical protein